MKIKIIIYSQTGNTLSVAERLEKELAASGHTVTIEKVTTEKESDSSPDLVKFTNEPSIDGYDVLIFGAPVHAFKPAVAMQAYLNKQTLTGKTVMIFVTMLFPFDFLGGKGAVKKLCSICRSKGAQVLKTGIVNWSKAEKREKKIEEIINKFKA